jgi:predicted AAA+ superfamily ATPase
LTEQYVLQQLITNKNITPFYWTSEKSKGEIDFVFQSGTNIVPLEVKAAENLQAKSLKSYCSRYEPKYAIRCKTEGCISISYRGI